MLASCKSGYQHTVHMDSVRDTCDCHGNSCGDYQARSTDMQSHKPVTHRDSKNPFSHVERDVTFNSSSQAHTCSLWDCVTLHNHTSGHSKNTLSLLQTVWLTYRHQVISVATGHPGGAPVMHPVQNNLFLLERKAWCCVYTLNVQTRVPIYEMVAMSTKLSPLPTPAVYCRSYDPTSRQWQWSVVSWGRTFRSMW